MEKEIAEALKLETACRRLRAMAHPIRIRIIDLLSKNREMTVTQLYTQLKMAQAIVSQHLKILKNDGIVHSRRRGKMMYYSLRNRSLTNVIMTLFPGCHL